MTRAKSAGTLQPSRRVSPFPSVWNRTWGGTVRTVQPRSVSLTAVRFVRHHFGAIWGTEPTAWQHCPAASLHRATQFLLHLIPKKQTSPFSSNHHHRTFTRCLRWPNSASDIPAGNVTGRPSTERCSTNASPTLGSNGSLFAAMRHGFTEQKAKIPPTRSRQHTATTVFAFPAKYHELSSFRPRCSISSLPAGSLSSL